MLEKVSKSERKDLQRTATRLYKSGARPTTVERTAPLRRFEKRQVARAAGWRGSKATRQKASRLRDIQQAILVDDLMVAAEDRVQHPVRSRLRRR